MDRQNTFVFKGLTLLQGLVEDLDRVGRQGFVFLTLLFVMSVPVFAQPDSLWSHQYGQYGNAWGRSFLATADGGFLLAGNIGQVPTSAFWLVKTDSEGDTEWTRAYGAGRYGSGGYLCSAADGGYYVAGTTATQNFCALRVTSNGDSLWARQYDGLGTDNCLAVAASRDGGALLSGYRENQDGFEAMFLKTNANGDSLWSHLLGTSGLRFLSAAHQTLDGGYILSGMSNDPSAGGYDFYLVRTDSLGNTLWQRTYGGPNNEMYAHVVICEDGGYVLAGTTRSYGTGLDDVWLLRTNADGDSLWSHTYGGVSYDQCSAVAALPDGGFVLGARTESFGAPGNNFWLIRTDADGDSLWSRVFGTDNNEWCNDVQATRDGGYALLGGVNLSPEGDQAMWLVKTSPDPLLFSNPRFILPPSALSVSNFPNPFNPSTWISFDLPKSENISLKVFDLLGREVIRLKDGIASSGTHQVLFDGKRLASGTYMLRLEANGTARTKKITLLK